MKSKLTFFATLLLALMLVMASCTEVVYYPVIVDNTNEKQSEEHETVNDEEIVEEEYEEYDEQYDDEEPVEVVIEKEKEPIIVSTGGPTGTYYAYGMALTSVIADETDLEFDVMPSGASKANIQLIQLEGANVAIVQNDVMYYAYTGTDLFVNEQIQDFSAMAVLYPELCQIIATKESGIKTVADLKGKRVSVGDAGSGVEFNAKQILNAYGIDMNNDIQKQNLGFGPSADALKEGKIDAFFCVAGIPTTAITELALNNDIEVVEVEDDEFAELSARYGFYTQQVIPAGTYKGVDEDKKTVAVMATLIADKELDEDVVYEFTKALFENKRKIAKAHAKGEQLDLANAINGIPSEVPIHPGAKKYYRECGVIR